MTSRQSDNLGPKAATKRRIPRIGGNWRYFALFRLLQLSPSYWLAHEEAISGVSPQSRLPTEFELVRQTYGLFGPLWEIPFWEWWVQRGQGAFGLVDPAKPVVLAQTHGQGLTEAAGLSRKVLEHFSAADQPPSLLLAVPLSGSKAAILAEFERLLDNGRANLNNAARYQIITDKTRRETVNAAIRTVQAKAHFGGPLYVAGNRAVIAEYVRTDDSKASGYGDERRIMAMVTSRQLKRAHIWSENAARGRFPSSQPPASDKDWPPFDFQELEPRLAAYAHSSLAALERIPLAQRTNEERYAGRNWTIRW